MKSKNKLIGLLVVATLTTLLLAGCEQDPVTGKDLFTGYLRVVNESGPISGTIALYAVGSYHPQVWLAPSYAPIATGGNHTFKDIPTGTYDVVIGGNRASPVVFSAGMTTTVTLRADGNLIFGGPLP
jgi:hypothetical protein